MSAEFPDADLDATSPRVLVAICTYNERENLPPLVASVKDAVPSADLLVIDDSSPDGTGQWAEEAAATDPKLQVIQRSGKLGLGSAIVKAMQFAIDNDYDYIINLDGDRSHNPERIPEMIAIAEREQADIVIGSRYVPGGAIEGWSMRRKIMSSMLNSVARRGLRLPAKDCSGAFRCYRVSTLQQTDLSKIRAKGYAMLEEILWLLAARDLKVLEIPITFVNRTVGDSKLSFTEAVRSASVILRLTVTPRR